MNSSPHILVVEDNEDDAFFMRRALRAAAPGAVNDFVGDGQAALEYLRGTGKFAHRANEPLPDVVFLDLKLPYVYGLDVLATIRSTPGMEKLPVVILTSSGEERDRSAAATLGIVGYLVKPPSSLLVAEALNKVPASASPSAAAAPSNPASQLPPKSSPS